MDQVHHLDAAVVVEIALQDRAARRAHDLDRGPVVEKVVDRLERPVAEIRYHGLHAAFGLAQEDGVRVRHGLLGVQHGGDPAEDDLDAPAAEGVGDPPGALDLNGQHHRDADEVRGLVEVERLDVFVDEDDLDLRRQGGGEHDRPVGRQVELGLPVELGPLGVDQQEFHRRWSFIALLCFRSRRAVTGC